MNRMPSVSADVLSRVPLRKAVKIPATLICFSHLRWDFVYQRPQHLLSRFANDTDVFYVEEPMYGDWQPHYVITEKAHNLHVVVPHLPEGRAPEMVEALQRELLDDFLAGKNMLDTAFWY